MSLPAFMHGKSLSVGAPTTSTNLINERCVARTVCEVAGFDEQMVVIFFRCFQVQENFRVGQGSVIRVHMSQKDPFVPGRASRYTTVGRYS